MNHFKSGHVNQTEGIGFRLSLRKSMTLTIQIELNSLYCLAVPNPELMTNVFNVEGMRRRKIRFKVF